MNKRSMEISSELKVDATPKDIFRLNQAVEDGDSQMLRALVSMNVKFSKGILNENLLKAIRGNHESGTSCIKCLLVLGAETLWMTSEGISVLDYAIKSGCSHDVLYMLSVGQTAVE